MSRCVCLYQVSLTHRYREDSSLAASSLLAKPLANKDTIPGGTRDVSLFHSIQVGSGPQRSTTFYIATDLSLLNIHG